MVLRLKTTALLRVELACEPMNQTVVSLGFRALREVRLLKSGRQCIVMFLCGCKHSSVLTYMEAGGRKISDGTVEKREWSDWNTGFHTATHHSCCRVIYGMWIEQEPPFDWPTCAALGLRAPPLPSQTKREVTAIKTQTSFPVHSTVPRN